MSKSAVSRLCARPRRAGAPLPRAPARGRLPLPLAGRQGGAGPRARRRASQGARGRLRRARDGPPRGHRHRRRRGRDRGLLARVPALPARPRPRRRAALRLRRPRGPQGGDRQGARLPLAALHRALPARHARPLRARRSSRMVAAAIRQIFAAEDAGEARERLGGVVARPRAERRPRWRACSTAAEEDLLAFMGFPRRALVEAALDQPAGARQPRDRPPHRRRRHLPQRRRPHPPRRRAAHRAERRVARRPPLPLGGVARSRCSPDGGRRARSWR